MRKYTITLGDKIAFTGWAIMIFAIMFLPGQRWGAGEWTFTIGSAICVVGMAMQVREVYLEIKRRVAHLDEEENADG